MTISKIADNMKMALSALWQLFVGLLFYPVMIVIFLWLYFTGKHWIFGVIVIAAILILDPMWRVIGRRILDMVRPSK